MICFSVNVLDSLISFSPHTRRVLRLTTAQDVLEGPPELDGHGVVENGVDGAVDVDHDPTEEEEPGVPVLNAGEGVVYHHHPVRHPENGENAKDDNQHPHHLQHIDRVTNHQTLKET